MTLLAKRYASALFALATEQNAVDAVGRDLAALHELFADDAARAVLTSPDVTPTERQGLLQKLGSGRHALVGNLIGVLQQRRRLDVLFHVHLAFRALRMQAAGEVDGVVESAMALDDAELQSLTALAGRLTGKKVQLSVAVRPELIGGVRLRLGNVLYDGSLRASLDQLEQKLSQASI